MSIETLDQIWKRLETLWQTEKAALIDGDTTGTWMEVDAQNLLSLRKFRASHPLVSKHLVLPLPHVNEDCVK